MVDFTFSQDTMEVMDRLKDHGFEAWIVGGAIRDSLLGRPVHDVDITTDARPEQIEEAFHDVRTIDVGKAFGTIRVLWKDSIFEITTYRSDGKYEDGRHPSQVQFSTDIREDLKRRDFTINAMAWNPDQGLLDLFHGEEDLDQGIVRAVGNAQERIHEDALRMLRAVRFTARYNFSMEESLQEAVKNSAPKISQVSRERSLEEMDQILLHDHVALGIKLLKDLGLLACLLPQVSDLEESAYEKTLALAENLRPKLDLRWASLFRYLGYAFDTKGEIAKKAMKDFRSSTKRQKNVSFLVQARPIESSMSLAEARRLKGRIGEKWSLLYDFLSTEERVFYGEVSPELKNVKVQMDTIEEENLAVSSADLAIDGGDLIQLGFQEGKLLGQTLKDLLNLVIDERLENDREDLLKYARGLLEG